MNMIKTAMRGVEVASLRGLRTNSISIPQTSDTDDLLDLVPVHSPNEGMPSAKQMDLINRLIGDLRKLDAGLADQADGYMAKMAGRWTLGRDGNASRWIDRLISKVRELTVAQRSAERSAPTATTETVEDGMYVLNGEIFKVQHAIHGSGKPYAKLFVPPAGPGLKATFVYTLGAIKNLRPEHRMTKEQARQYGKLTGTCVFCARVLTDERSIDAGYGEKCASNNGLPWG